MASLEAGMDRGTVGLSRRDSEMVMIYIVRTKRSDFPDFFCVSKSIPNVWSRRHASSTALRSVVRIYQCLLIFQPQLNQQTYLALTKVIICQGRCRAEGFIFLLVCLLSVHEWRTAFCLTFSQPGRIGNAKVYGKLKLSKIISGFLLWTFAFKMKRLIWEEGWAFLSLKG